MGTLKNGTLWKDVSGAPLHAHGGYIIFYEGYYYCLRVKSSLPKSIYLSEPLARFIQINFKKQLTQKPKCAAALVTDSIKR